MVRLSALALVLVLIVLAPPVWVSMALSDGLRRDLRAADAKVRVVAGPVGIVTGRVRALEFAVRGAALDGFRVSELRGSWRGVTIDAPRAWRGALVIQRVTGGTAAVTVTDADLQQYLNVVKGVHDARVHLDDGVITLDGGVTVLGAVVPVSVRGALAVEETQRVVLRIDQMIVDGVTLPPDLGAALAATINPLLVAPRTPVALTFTGVQVDAGRAVITAVPAQ